MKRLNKSGVFIAILGILLLILFQAFHHHHSIQEEEACQWHSLMQISLILSAGLLLAYSEITLIRIFPFLQSQNHTHHIFLIPGLLNLPPPQSH